MYDDNHRILFNNVPIASQSVIITPDSQSSRPHDDDGNIIFTHLHNHKDFEIIFIKSGIAHFTIDGTPIEAHSGDLLLVNPYELHFGVADCTMETFSFYCFTFDLSILCTKASHPVAEMCSDLWERTAKFDNIISDSDEAVSIISELEKKFKTKCSAWEYYMYAHMFEFFGFLVGSGYLRSIDYVSKEKIFVKKVQEYIEENFLDNINSADAAAALSYNNSYFCRLFRKNFGRTFSEYLNFYRVNYAKELLEGGCSVSKAAFASGYNDVSYFIKKFKKYNAYTPSEYIHQIK